MEKILFIFKKYSNFSNLYPRVQHAFLLRYNSGNLSSSIASGKLNIEHFDFCKISCILSGLQMDSVSKIFLTICISYYFRIKTNICSLFAGMWRSSVGNLVLLLNSILYVCYGRLNQLVPHLATLTTYILKFLYKVDYKIWTWNVRHFTARIFVKEQMYFHTLHRNFWYLSPCKLR